MRRRIESRRLGRGEAIRVSSGNREGGPKVMIWRGRRHRIRAAERCRPAPGAPPASPPRHYFQLVTDEGMRALVSQEILGDRWRMEAVLSRHGGGI